MNAKCLTAKDRLFNLLIADDEYLMRECLEKFFDWNSIGFNVVGSFENGQQVLECLAAQLVDVCLLDIEMPGVNGIAVAEYARRHNPDCIMVFLSGFSEFEYAQRAIDLGVRKYLLKPVTFEQIYTVFTAIYDQLRQSSRLTTEPQTGLEHVNINDILAYIDANLDNGALNLSMIAGEFYYNPAYLGRLFKKNTQIGFNEYLMRKRMERASEYLIQSGLPVYEVCRHVGYVNIKYFYKQFKSHFGMSPKEYRKTYADT